MNVHLLVFSFLCLVLCKQAVSLSPCPSTCQRPNKAIRQCKDQPLCTLSECTFGRRNLSGLSCVPRAEPSCPEKCIDLVWAREACADLDGCEVKQCTRNVRGRVEKPGGICTKVVETPKPDCPDTCIDPRWAEEKCKDLDGCQVEDCTRLVRGRTEKAGKKCAPIPPPQVECPDKCIDPLWAEKKCEGLEGCEVQDCTRLVRGVVERPGAKCAPKKLECPEKCIDPKWAEKRCKDYEGCVIKDCTRKVRGVVERPGKVCTKPCPNKCIDPKWAEEACKEYPGCVLKECTRLVLGETEKMGAMCSDM